MAALTNFIDNSLPTIKAIWLNQVDAFVNTLFNAATTAAQARTALGLSPVAIVSPGLGQCLLTLSGGNLLLSPLNGNQILINGQYQTVPAAGVTLSPAGTVTLTLYYIYVFMVGAVMTLEFSTTAPATDATTGMRIKTGDGTRSLVGMARPVGGAWIDSEAQRFVLSWFNQKPKSLNNPCVSGSNTGSGTYVELSTTYRMEFLVWSNNIVHTSYSGSMSNSSTATGYIGLAFDSSTAVEDAANIDQPVSNNNLPFAITKVKTGLTEGYHYVTIVARVFAGAGLVFINAGSTQGERSSGTGYTIG